MGEFVGGVGCKLVGKVKGTKLCAALSELRGAAPTDEPAVPATAPEATPRSETIDTKPHGLSHVRNLRKRHPMLRIILVLLVGGPRLGGLHLQKWRLVDGHSRGAHSPPLAFAINITRDWR
jgi:hypothetical protein